MEKVINIEKISGDFDSRLQKCEITIEDEGSTKTVTCNLGDTKMQDYIISYADYLKSLLELKKDEVVENRKQKNMKASICYAIGVVGIFGAALSSSKTLVPFFIAAAVVGLIPALFINIGFLTPFENSKEAKDIYSKLEDLDKLLKESKNKYDLEVESENENQDYEDRKLDSELEEDFEEEDNFEDTEEVEESDTNLDSDEEMTVELDEESYDDEYRENLKEVRYQDEEETKEDTYEDFEDLKDKEKKVSNYEKVSLQSKKNRFEKMRNEKKKKHN